MSTPDFFRSRLNAMIDRHHPLVVLAGRLPLHQIETALARKLGLPGATPGNTKAISDLQMWLERAERSRRTQQRSDKNKLYALHAPEVECIGKGKARKPYEVGVKVSLAVTHEQGLMEGARSFPGNPYDGNILAVQIEQTTNLLQDLERKSKQAVVDLGFRGVDDDNPGIEVIHRGGCKSLTTQQKRWLKRRQAIEPMIGHYPSPTTAWINAGCKVIG